MGYTIWHDKFCTLCFHHEYFMIFCCFSHFSNCTSFQTGRVTFAPLTSILNRVSGCLQPTTIHITWSRWGGREAQTGVKIEVSCMPSHYLSTASLRLAHHVQKWDYKAEDIQGHIKRDQATGDVWSRLPTPNTRPRTSSLPRWCSHRSSVSETSVAECKKKQRICQVRKPQRRTVWTGGAAHLFTRGKPVILVAPQV